jgi:DNA-binding NtrC family response regulator
MNIIKTDDVMKKRILLVDDNEDMLMLCSRELIKAGYDVTTACSAKRGLEIFEQQNSGIAAVVLDVLMPDMDGRRLFGKMRELDESMLIVLYSNYGNTYMLTEWGVPRDTPYVIKGNEHELVDIIRNAQQKEE